MAEDWFAQNAPTSNAPPGGGNWFVDNAPDKPTALQHFGSKMVEGSSLLSAASHPLETLKSLTGYDEVKKTVDAYQAGDYKAAASQFIHWVMSNPGTKAADSLIDTSREQFGKAVKAYKDGDYPLVLSHGGAALIPILKPLAESAELSKQGDISGAGGLVAGQVFDMAAPAALKEYGPAVVQGTREAAAATADNLTRIAAEHPKLVEGVGASVGATAGGTVGTLIPVPGSGPAGAVAGGYAGREAGKALVAAAKAKIPPPFPSEPPPLPGQPPPIPNPAANIDYTSIPGVGPRPAYLSQPAPVPVDPALDEIAQRFGAKDYASAGKAVQELADKIHTGGLHKTAPYQGPETGAMPAPVEAPAPTAPLEAPAPSVPAPESSAPPASFLDQENTGLQIPRVVSNRAAKAQRFINKLGGTQNLPRTQAEWQKVADAIGENIPSKETQDLITAGLNKLMRAGKEKAGSIPPPEVPNWIKNAKDPSKALKLAEKLKQAIEEDK